MAQYSRKLSKGTFYFYKFDLEGKTYRSKAIFDTKQEAKDAEAEAYQRARQHQKHPTQPQEVLMLDAINERLDYIKVRKSKSYYNDSRRYLSILAHTFDTLSVVTKLDIERILAEQVERGTYTANALLRAFKAFFNHTIQNHNLDLKNPCQYIKPFAVEKRIKYIPSNKEIETLLAHCDENQKRLIEFLRDTGARLSEALNLTGKDITNVEVVLYTRKSANSNLVPRQVPKPDCLVGLTFQPNQKVFGYWTEQPKFLERKLKTLKLPKWGFHSLRHRYASILSAENRPLYELMSLLGHSNLDTTQRYLQLIPKYIRNDVGTIDRENMASERL